MASHGKYCVVYDFDSDTVPHEHPEVDSKDDAACIDDGHRSPTREHDAYGQKYRKKTMRFSGPKRQCGSVTKHDGLQISVTNGVSNVRSLAVMQTMSLHRLTMMQQLYYHRKLFFVMTKAIIRQSKGERTA